MDPVSHPIIPIRGTLVRLRVVLREDLPLLLQWENDPDVSGPANDFTFHSQVGYERDHAENGLLEQAGGLLLVEGLAEGAAVGMVGYRDMRVPHRGPEFGCQLIPQARGKGYGTEAQRLLVDYLFGQLGAHRVQAQTATVNHAEQGALRRIGLVQEGIRRQAAYLHGVWLDLMIFGMLRSEWQARRSP